MGFRLSQLGKRKGLWMGGNVPLGYQADGRTLKIDLEEAATIKMLYDLYLEYGVIRVVKEKAEVLGLRSRQRIRGAGRVSGGIHFDRGHIHHILSNPIYAGRIRHRGQVYEGRHTAIIEPEVWDRVQRMLQNGAPKTRGTKRKTLRSLLAGKLFDETGDRLTPSHSRKNGKRLRYYISHRLVKDRSQKHPDAWRLPADELETLISDLMRNNLSRPDVVAALMPDVSAAEIPGIAAKLQSVQSAKQCFVLVSRVDLKPGQLNILLSPDEIAELVGCERNRIDPTSLLFEAPFRMRRRGVELKLHLEDAPSEVDLTLVQNVLKAQRWMAMILNGKTFAEIAEADGTSKRRVQDVVDLAMLAPDILDVIANGEQPDGLTSDYLIKSGVPAAWSDQRAQFAKL